MIYSQHPIFVTDPPSSSGIPDLTRSTITHPHLFITMSHSHFDYDGPRKANPGPNEVGIIVYGYLPSLTLPLIAIITFAMTLAAQVFYSVKKPKMYRTFHILMAIGSVCSLHSASCFNLITRY